MSLRKYLPSNASFAEFQENRNGAYSTRLVRCLLLMEGEWEVGLVDMHYSNTWHNVTEGTMTYVEKEEILNSPSVTSHPSTATDSTTTLNECLFDIVFSSNLYSPDPYIPDCTKPSDQTPFKDPVKFKVLPGRYLNFVKVVDALRNAIYEGDMQRKICIVYDKQQNIVTVYGTDTLYGKITVSRDLCQIMGFESTLVVDASP